MNWRKLFGAATLLALATGCGEQAGDVEEQMDAPAAPGGEDAGPPVVWVRVLVTHRADGTGNALWTPLFTGEVLRAAQKAVVGQVRFELVGYEAQLDDTLYALPQLQLLYRVLLKLRERGILTMVVSGEETTDSAGVSTIGWELAPVVVMRARETDWGPWTARATAEILLHEMGHQMGLRHTAQPLIGLPWTTDSYWGAPEGLVYLATWAAALAKE